METKHGIKYRQLHIEDYLREIPAEQGKVTGVYAQEWITGTTGTNTEFWTDNLLDTILRSDNLNAAYKKVKANKGTGGIDGMQVDELLPYLIEHRDELVRQLREGKYKPSPVRRVEIPKEEKGKVRKLGIPTVVDRLIQQAIAQELTRSTKNSSQKTATDSDRAEAPTTHLQSAGRMWMKDTSTQSAWTYNPTLTR